MNYRLLLLGDTSSEVALGSKLLRGARDSSIAKDWEIVNTYSSPGVNYSPSMKTIPGKIFYRLNSKRSWEWREFETHLAAKIKQSKPNMILVTGIMPLSGEIFEVAKMVRAKIVNYLTDDPWNPNHRRKSFTTTLGLYNHIFSTKESLRLKLKAAGCTSTSWLPFAYDPYLHYPVEKKSGADIAFIGTGAKERLKWLKELSRIKNVKRVVYGNSWRGLKVPNWDFKEAVTGNEYCHAISDSKIVLGLLRAANGDLSTDRSYEIGAIGGCGIYQDTTEHRQLLVDYPKIGFFKSPEDLRDKVLEVLSNSSLQNELREKGAFAIRKAQNTYTARLEEILTWRLK